MKHKCRKRRQNSVISKAFKNHESLFVFWIWFNRTTSSAYSRYSCTHLYCCRADSFCFDDATALDSVPRHGGALDGENVRASVLWRERWDTRLKMSMRPLAVINISSNEDNKTGRLSKFESLSRCAGALLQIAVTCTSRGDTTMGEMALLQR
jgi:hypothetical protein